MTKTSHTSSPAPSPHNALDLWLLGPAGALDWPGAARDRASEGDSSLALRRANDVRLAERGGRFGGRLFKLAGIRREMVASINCEGRGGSTMRHLTANEPKRDDARALAEAGGGICIALAVRCPTDVVGPELLVVCFLGGRAAIKASARVAVTVVARNFLASVGVVFRNVIGTAA